MGKLQFHSADPRADVYEDLSEKLKKMHWKKETDRQIMVKEGRDTGRRYMQEVEREGPCS